MCDVVCIRACVCVCLCPYPARRPVRGDLPPDDALTVLNAFEGRVKQLATDAGHLSAAKVALGIDFLDTDRTLGIHAELASLKEAWGAVRGVWKGLTDLKDLPWANVAYRKVWGGGHACRRGCSCGVCVLAACSCVCL